MTPSVKTTDFQNFSEFWPFYLSEHSNPKNRNLHFAGTTLAILALTIGLSVGPLWLAYITPVFGYFFAWIGHFKVQKNRPATFKYPGWSLRGDFKLYFYTISGRLNDEYKKYGLSANS